MTIFKAYDVRGIFGTEVTEEEARRIGMAFGSWAKGGKVCTGRDTRISGPSLQGELVKGILSTGCEVKSYGVVPIAILSFITWKDGLFAAAYISASHNPPEYNGVRFRTGDWIWPAIPADRYHDVLQGRKLPEGPGTGDRERCQRGGPQVRRLRQGESFDSSEE